MATKAKTMRVKILAAGEWGGDVVSANADYETGGPVHPDQAKRKNSPKPDFRDGDQRYPGDVVEFPVERAYDLMRLHVAGVTDESAVKDPEGTRAFVKAVQAGEDPTAAAAA